MGEVRAEGWGDYVTVLQTYAWLCEETPGELEKVKGAENSSRDAEKENDKNGQK